MGSISLKARPQGAPIRLSGQQLWRCSNRLGLTCTSHGEEISVACGRWRTCPGCARRLQWSLQQRFLAGIEVVPAGKKAMFFTLTFPLSDAPDESEAHAALRALTRRLRYRDYLGEYGWVLHRQRNATLHYHGIAHLPWFKDGLNEWRELITASGFGVQNKLLVADPAHAGYCTRYISTRLADLAPLRRAYAFSKHFPRPPTDIRKEEISALLAEIAGSNCSWEVSVAVRAALSKTP